MRSPSWSTIDLRYFLQDPFRPLDVQRVGNGQDEKRVRDSTSLRLVVLERRLIHVSDEDPTHRAVRHFPAPQVPDLLDGVALQLVHRSQQHPLGPPGGEVRLRGHQLALLDEDGLGFGLRLHQVAKPGSLLR